ncbi:COP9 signalosome complex subunit 4 [Entophlyctis luteolus]|nr:COP9 signalosome complex subunit 4 [Entophlyctis luteolus]
MSIPRDRDAFTAELRSALAAGPAQSPIFSGPVSLLMSLVDAAVDESLGLVLNRVLLTDFVDAVASAWKLKADSDSALPDNEVDGVTNIWLHALQVTAARQVAFEEQITSIRLHLADIYEMKEEWTEAAKVLIGIPIDSGHRIVDDKTKIEVYVRIVRLLLEDDDAVAAEAYLNRAALLVTKPEFETSTVPHNMMLTLQFRAAQARLLDFKRMFLLAAHKYLSLSYVTAMAESERLICLIQAVCCAILAPADKDDRVRESSELYQIYFPVLEKMYLDRILRANEIEGFRQALKPHQLALLSGGTTVLDRAVVEHNILAASKIYTTVTFTELSSLLGVKDAAAAESLVSKMIGEGRVDGHIDQIEGMLYFSQERQSSLMSRSIRGICEQVDGVVETVMKKNPVWVMRVAQI